MLRFLIRRVFFAVVTLFAVSVLTFAMFFAIAASPAALQCGKNCSPTQVAQIEKSLGLDKPLTTQYAEYMKGIFVGRTIGSGETAIDCPAPCFGYSFRGSVPVSTLLAQALPITLSIVIGGAILWILTGLALGVISALRQGSAIDKTAIGISLAGASLQVYFVGLVLQLIFVYKLHWLPAPSYTSPLDNPLSWAGGLLLPWITLAILSSAIYARLTRAQMLETLSEDFVRTARAKGLPKRTVQLRHALRAGITPIITIAGLDVGGALGGAVITENVFGLQGLGFISVQAAQQLNLPIVMATVLLSAFFIISSNVLVDILYAFVDPRVKLG